MLAPTVVSADDKLKLSDFDMIRTLGTGSFGRVKYAKCKTDGQYYAVKLMKKHDIIRMKQGMCFLHSFLHASVDHINCERSIMLELSHPFIVNMRGSFKV